MDVLWDRVGRLPTAARVRERVSLAQYRIQAPVYEFTSGAGTLLRQVATERLALRRGDLVVDMGCGTGLSFPLLQAGIGPTGRLVGVEPSAAMLARAKESVVQQDWDNVTLVEGTAEEADVSVQADALLLCMVHDLMRSPDGLRRALRALRPGGRVVAAGSKWADWWALPVNMSTWYLNRPCVTTFEGFDEPWSHLVDLVPELEVDLLAPYLGGAYIASGVVHEAP